MVVIVTAIVDQIAIAAENAIVQAVQVEVHGAQVPRPQAVHRGQVRPRVHRVQDRVAATKRNLIAVGDDQVHVEADLQVEVEVAMPIVNVIATVTAILGRNPRLRLRVRSVKRRTKRRKKLSPRKISLKKLKV